MSLIATVLRTDLLYRIACNDNNANTGNDIWNANCQCAGQVIDCEGTIGGSALLDCIVTTTTRTRPMISGMRTASAQVN
ncbi:MAG: hypothetical protein IPI91_14120 [Flavobacteriales bacterium]|nr:hypothetical protein [Flavobacteriales bacterium]